MQANFNVNVTEAIKENVDYGMSESGAGHRGRVMHCDPCETEGRHSQAKGFCINCNDYLCLECFTIHRRPILWRYHELRDEQTMPRMKPATAINEECVEPCAQHPKRNIEYFCHTHMKLVCSLCVFRSHRYCENVVYIPDIAGRNSESEELDVLSGTFGYVLEDIKANKKLVEQSLEEVHEMQEKAESKIKMLKTEICSFLDKLREDVCLISHSENTKLTACSNSFNSISKRIKTCVINLEKERKEGKMSQLFVDLKLAKLTLKDVITDVEETKAHCKMQPFDVEIDDDVTMEIQKCLAKICVSVRPPVNKEKTGPVLQDMNSIEVSEAGKSPQAEHVDDTTVKHRQEEKLEGTGQIIVQDETQFLVELNRTNTKTDTRNDIEGKCSHSDYDDIIQYDREILLSLQTSVHALRKPAGIPDIPDIVFNDLQESYLRWMNAKHQGINKFRSSYVWSESNTKRKSQVKGTENWNDTPEDCSKVPSKKNVKVMLHRMIVKEMRDDEYIIDWIENNVDDSMKSGTAFVNVLMKTICRFSSDKDDKSCWTFHPETILERKGLLLKYVGSNFDLELQALYAVQIFIEQHNQAPGVLRTTFFVLYDAGIISKDAFFKWETSEEKPDIREECLKQTVPFFTWLLTKDRRQ